MRARVLAAGLVLVAADALGAERRAPELIVVAPPELAAAAARVERLDPERMVRLMRFVGLDRPGEPIQVILEPAGSDVDRVTPTWVAGYAHGSLGRVVLFPQRSPPYPYGSFDEVLLHELTHVFAARAAGHADLPRWFNEGLALVAAGSWGLDDRRWLTLAAVLDPKTPLAELEAMFRAGRGRSARAYAVSGAFVRDLVAQKGSDVVARILARRRVGLPFEEAFRRSVGANPEAVARAFWRRYSLWYRWVPLLTSSLTLWLGITLLAMGAAMRKRRRRALMEERWEAEDREAARRAGHEADLSPPGGWVH